MEMLLSFCEETAFCGRRLHSSKSAVTIAIFADCLIRAIVLSSDTTAHWDTANNCDYCTKLFPRNDIRQRHEEEVHFKNKRRDIRSNVTTVHSLNASRHAPPSTTSTYVWEPAAIDPTCYGATGAHRSASTIDSNDASGANGSNELASGQFDSHECIQEPSSTGITDDSSGIKDNTPRRNELNNLTWSSELSIQHAIAYAQDPVMCDEVIESDEESPVPSPTRSSLAMRTYFSNSTVSTLR